MENVVIFYDHLEHFTAIWYNLWPFGIVCCHFDQEKSGNPDAKCSNKNIIEIFQLFGLHRIFAETFYGMK
jgi:hypothetical protein